MGNVGRWTQQAWDVMRGVPISGKDPAKQDFESRVEHMNKSQDAAELIERHVAAGRDSADEVRVPRPRTEEDAISQGALDRIRWHVKRALPRPRR